MRSVPAPCEAWEGARAAVALGASAVAARIPPADLDERDPDYIRESLPGLWLLASLYFRGRGPRARQRPRGRPGAAGRQPLRRQPHAGHERLHARLLDRTSASSAPSTSSPTTSCSPCPGLGFLRKYGTVAASPENARKALRSGAAVLVYPGGDYEVHRPVWERHRVDFDGRKGFIRLALQEDVPIVPVVAVGGQETSIFLSRGESLARALNLDRLFRLKVLPISLALPWGLNVGDFLGHFPLPAKITVEALPPIHLREEFGDGPGPRRGLRPHPAPDAGDPRRAGRRAPAPAGRMRVAASIDDRRARRARLGAGLRPRPLPALHVRRHPLGGQPASSAPGWARATGCSCASGRPRSAA